MDDQKRSFINYHDFKNKLIYFVCFGMMLTILTSVYYVCFFREIEIDLTQHLQISFIGENGNGIIQTTRDDFNYNQRIQPFYDTLEEEVSSNGSLANGDKVQVSINYDEVLAEQLHIHVSENTVEITVEGLAERFESTDDISEEYMDKLTLESDRYLKKDQDRILREDFTLENDIKYVGDNLLQKVFLKAENSQEHDRIVFVYEVSAQGKKDTEELQEEKIYYMIVFDDVNSNLKLNDNQVYGEKALSTQEDLTTEEGIVRYFKSKYVLSYEVEII